MGRNREYGYSIFTIFDLVALNAVQAAATGAAAMALTVFGADAATAQGVADSHEVGPDWIWDVQTPAETTHTNNILSLIHI